MSIRQFIRKNRAEITTWIRTKIGPSVRLNDEDRRQWILNDEGLYLWARREGVKI